MKYSLVSLAVIGMTLSLSTPNTAQTVKECGEPPISKPRIPSTNGITAEQIRNARDSVLAYSESVDEYLQCMDDRFNVLGTYLTEEQRTQYNNDLASLHDGRRELQIQMNAAIRAFRAGNSSGR